MELITGLYDSVEKVDAALRALHGLGYIGDDISIIARDDIVKGDTRIENDTMEGVKDGALTGVLAGGLIAGLKELGYDEMKAKQIEDAIKEGSILLGVKVREEDDDSKIKNLLDSHGANDVSVVEVGRD